tara:strand:+ start:599 stop:1990 length:1392 start_codon:yes stop_codon:yes gene_type:complete
MNHTDSYNNKGFNVQQLINKLTDISHSENISKWDIGASFSEDISVQVDHGESKQLKGSQRNAITIRAWNNKGLVGTTSTTDLTDAGLIKALKGAKEASQFGNKNEIPDFSPLANSPIVQLNRPIGKRNTIKDLLELLKKAESDLLNSHEAISSVPYNGLSESYLERIYLNSAGAYRHINSTQSSIYLYAKCQEKGRKPRSSGSIRLSHSLDKLDITGCVNESSSKTLSHLNYSSIDTGKYLVCFTPEAFLDMIYAFGSIFNARSVIDGVSLSNRNSIGETIAYKNLSIYDNPLHQANIGASPFDGEGTPTSKICIVNNGILESFIHSEYTARQFGVKPTGHAGMGSKVSVGLDWLEISKCNQLNDELNYQHLNHNTYKDKFILIESLNAIHAGVKASQGSFSLPFDGWIIKDGEKVSIEAATVAGDIKYLLNNIIHIESTSKITHQGISPYVWVDNLSITGEV